MKKAFTAISFVFEDNQIPETNKNSFLYSVCTAEVRKIWDDTILDSIYQCYEPSEKSEGCNQ